MSTLSLAFICLTLTPVVTGPSPLANGGFEHPKGWSGNAPSDWGDCAGAFARVEAEPHSGAWCGEIRGVRLRYMAAASRVAVSREQPFLLRAWVRTALTPGEGAFLAASFSKGGRYSHVRTSARLTGKRPWTLLELLLPPESRQEADSVQISFRVESQTGAGVAWVDDVELLPVTLPPPPPRAVQEQARQLQLARTMLVEREFWTERLAALRQRKRDLESLLASTPEAWQMTKPSPRSREALEASVPDDSAWIKGQLHRLAEVPGLKAACLAELETTLHLKRRLDSSPEKRRAWLRAQLPGPRQPLPPAPPQPLHADLARVLAEAQPPASGDLGEIATQAGLSPDAWLRSQVEVPTGEAGDELLAVLRAPDGSVIRWLAQPAGQPSTRFELHDLPVTAWTPELPLLYDWAVALRRQGRILELRRAPVAFREIAVVPGDLSGTMRHAWGWAAEDWSFLLNGQPWFPRGTVLNDLPRFPEEGSALLRELGLEFNRNYGYQTGPITSRLGDCFRRDGLLLLAALGPHFQEVTSFASRKEGFEPFRASLREDRALVHNPAVMAIQVGNEAELPVWGADLGASYGEDLWQPFEESLAILREESAPAVPLSYVRAGSYKAVAPVPAEDYSGINQYAGRYWGSRRTISADLGGLAFHAAAAGKPYGITEWFGPKYSWATSGISGVDEAGAARYLVDYQQAMERAPGAVLSTQFVLNWVVTPVEDLTTLPYPEARQRREQWTWSLQQGTPWYPHVFPSLLTDTPGRQQLRGMNSPLRDLVETPGRLLVSGPLEDAKLCAEWLRQLGRTVEVLPPGQLPSPEAARFSLLLLSPGHSPEPWLQAAALSSAPAPAPGSFALRRRLLPADPDRLLVVLCGGSPAGYQAGLERLRGDAAALTAAYAQRASCRRLLALVDTESSAWERYVTDTAMRGWFVARDDLRLRLDPGEILTPNGERQPAFADLALVLVAARRALEPGEVAALQTLAQLGVEVVWSASSLQANPLPGVHLGAPQSLEESVPVASWANQPLPLGDLGHIRAEPLRTFGALSPGGQIYRAATTARAVQAPGEVAARAGNQPVVVRQPLGKGAFWYCGADLASMADALTRTTQRGVNHHLYDRDTACGLERWFRLLTNAGARQVSPRPASRPRLRCDVQLDHLVLPPGAPLGATVVVRDQDGTLTDATLRGAVRAPSGSNYSGMPGAWTPLTRLSPGRYRLEVPAAELPPAADTSILDSQLLGVWISAESPGYVGDWTVASLAGARTGSEAQRWERLVEEIQKDLVRIPLSVNDESQYVEIRGTLTVELPLQAGVASRLRVKIWQIESDEGNDAMEEAELLLRPASGPPRVFPLAPGKVLCGPKQAAVKSRPADAVIVTSEHPFEVEIPWIAASGSWTAGLRYRYTDDFRPQIRAVERTDWQTAPAFDVP